MTTEQIKELAAAWIASEGRYSRASEELIDLLDDNPETSWLVIQEIAAREISDDVMAVLAAGPIEDLLARHGEKFIDRIEEKARRDQRFNFILGGVWQNMMSDGIWERVKKARKEVW